MTIKISTGNIDKIYLGNKRIDEVIFDGKIRYAQIDTSKHYYDTSNYEVGKVRFSNPDYDVILEKYIGPYENVIVPDEDGTDRSYHDQVLLTVIKTSGSNGISIYADCDEQGIPTCSNLICNVDMTGTGRSEATVDITGYPYVYLKCPGTADFGFEDKVMSGGTYTSYSPNTQWEVVKIIPTSNNITFQFSLD